MKKIFSLLKNKVVMQIVIIMLLIILAGGGIFFYFKTEGRIKVESSQVAAPIVSLTSTQPGKLRSVLVTEGQKIKKGDIIAIVGSENVKTYVDGTVIETNKQIGSLVSSQVALVKIVNLAEMRIDGTLDENKGLNKIKVGQPASFTIDAFPGKTYWGYVDEVAQSAKQTQLSFSISSERPVQQFDIYIRFDANKYPEIKNGMSAKTTIFVK